MHLLGVLAGFLALGAAWPVMADEKFDPKQVRVITPSNATSKCIGDPKTPICAVETLLACFARQKAELCKLVEAPEADLGDSTQEITYRVLFSKIIHKRDIPKSLADSYWIKPGYAEVEIEEVAFNNVKCSDFCRVSYALRPSPTGWIVIEWVAVGVD
ncbi:exported hypothetical protein [Rhodospirillaceae bacterium LM-1]|nr:exported hypothetical protein [Rhodospirillaceae bacterium LM-1]